MKPIILLSMTAILSLATTDFLWADCPENGGPNYGLPIGTFMGVVAKSNGEYTVEDCDPQIAVYQCVELIKRFAQENFRLPDNQGQESGLLINSVGIAANMWNILPDRHGFARYKNGSTNIAPQPTDILVWSGGYAGHVGIVKEVDSSTITVFEQNIQTDTAFRDLAFTKPNGIWNVEQGDHMSASYRVLGWLRFVHYGDFPEGQAQTSYSNLFRECAVRNNGFSVIGYPFDDGSGPYVHAWYPWGYLCQNVERKNSTGRLVQSGIMMYVPYLDEALYIGQAFWSIYRRGVDGRFGPDIPMGGWTTLGLPVTEALDGYQRFEGGYMQEVGGDLVLYNLADQEITRVPAGSVGISILPGNDSELVLVGWALSTSEVFLSTNLVFGATRYEVFLDGSYVCDLQNAEATVSGLVAETTYGFLVY